MSPRDWQAAGLITASQADAIERLGRGHGGAGTAELDRWADMGILTPSQLASIRRLESPRPAQLEEAAPPPAETVAAAGPGAEPAAAYSVLNPRVQGERAARGAESPSHSPAGLRFDMRQMGVALTLLALAGVAGSLLGVMTDVFIAPWRLVGADIEDLLHVTGALLGIAGGLAMYRGRASGPWLAVTGLALNILVTLAFAGGRLADPLVYVALVVWGGLIVMTLRSRRQPA